MSAVALPVDQLDELASALEKHEMHASSGRGVPQPGTGEPPKLRDELNRKALDELQRLILAHEHGKIAPSQFNAAIQTLWFTTAGLVSDEIKDLIGQTKAALLDDREDSVTRVLLSEQSGAVMKLTWKPDRGEVDIQQVSQGKLTRKIWSSAPDATFPAKDARSFLQSTCSALQTKGWRQI